MSRRTPIIAITIGDPSGVGPEIAVKALAERRRKVPVDGQFAAMLVGDIRIIERARTLFAPGLATREIDEPGEAVASDHVYVFDVPSEQVDVDDPVSSQGTAAAGTAAYDALQAATQLALAGEVDAVVTAPLNKEALSLAGHLGVGHTELLADFCGVARAEVAMMLASDRLKIAHVSTHVPLRTAIETLSTERIVTVGRLAGAAVARSIGRQPVIAVAGVNPHAGEAGLFGREDLDIIQPAVRALVEEGWNATGPVAPDTVFARAVAGAFDVVIAMYHDQGHIPAKLIGFHDTVNVTLGLPIVRVSVDHGTAYDIAWQGQADAANMAVAVGVAVRMMED